jgi:protein disulfide-isomerase
VNAIGRTGWRTLILLGLAAPAIAGDAVKVAWHNDVESAWKETQQVGRPLLVFVTREQCLYCVQMRDRTYSDLAVAGTIRTSFVPLVLDGGGNTRLLKDLRVTAFPSTFVISPQAVILDRIDGYLAPDAFTKRLNSLRPPYVPVAKVAKDP